MNRPGGDVALKPSRYLAEHRSTIGLSVEPYYRQKNCLLERAKDVGHCDYIVAIRSSQSSWPGTRAAEPGPPGERENPPNYSVGSCRCTNLGLNGA